MPPTTTRQVSVAKIIDKSRTCGDNNSSSSGWLSCKLPASPWLLSCRTALFDLVYKVIKDSNVRLSILGAVFSRMTALSNEDVIKLEGVVVGMLPESRFAFGLITIPRHWLMALAR